MTQPSNSTGAFVPQTGSLTTALLRGLGPAFLGLLRRFGSRARKTGAGADATRPMLTCKELIDFLWRYVDRQLSEPERRAFDMHLSMCDSCAAYLETYLRIVGLTPRAFADPEAAVPEEVPEDLVQGILAARRAAG